MEEFIEKFDKGEKFSEEELEELTWKAVEKIEDDRSRWTVRTEAILKDPISGRLFVIPYDQGLTEQQPNEYGEQPYEAEEIKTRVTVKHYIPIIKTDK